VSGCCPTAEPLFTGPGQLLHTSHIPFPVQRLSIRQLELARSLYHVPQRYRCSSLQAGSCLADSPTRPLKAPATTATPPMQVIIPMQAAAGSISAQCMDTRSPCHAHAEG
jgi:hypothetical protein